MLSISSKLTCDINHQAILPPHHSWIHAVDNNDSQNYQISLSCSSFHCLPYSTHLKLSDPNVRCKFKRSGTLCGQYQQGCAKSRNGTGRAPRVKNVFEEFTPFPVVK